ncbi:hypothetical protein magtcs_170 [Candidatus Hodgkinia cicadicola]|nr:hypothetical protein magtcs_170 [Candidatus Hodgkinia cicadicola]
MLPSKTTDGLNSTGRTGKTFITIRSNDTLLLINPSTTSIFLSMSSNISLDLTLCLLSIVIPVESSSSKITTKVFSNASESTVEVVSKSLEKLKMADISGYITTVYDNQWWLAYVLAKNEDNDEQVKVTFLHPSFAYPRRPVILWLSVNDVLCKVQTVTPTGRIYRIPESDEIKTNEAFNTYYELSRV